MVRSRLSLLLEESRINLVMLVPPLSRITEVEMERGLSRGA